MRSLTHHSIIISFLVIFIFAACERVEEDILQLMPESTQLLFENDYVRVLNVTLEQGEAQPLHQCGNRIIYALNDYTINYYQPEDTTEISWNKGGIHWHERGYHAVENIGETLVDYLLIERTETELPAAAPVVHEADPALPETGEVIDLFENNHARIARIILPAGYSMHDIDGFHRLVYSLSNYQIRYTSEAKGTIESEFNEGDFHWHSAGIYSIENIGDTDAEFIVFGFLQ